MRELEQFIGKLARRFNNGGQLSLKRVPNRMIKTIIKEAPIDFFLPALPLPVSLKSYAERIRKEAIKQVGDNMAEADRLLGLKPGLAGSDDAKVWETAQNAGRFLITQDLDFSDIRRIKPGTHHGILRSCFVVITEHKIRIRQP